MASFAEKPLIEGWANIGFMVFDRRVFDYLGGEDCILEREPLERLAAEGELMAYQHGGCFHAMDTYREYKALNEMWDRGEAPSGVHLTTHVSLRTVVVAVRPGSA